MAESASLCATASLSFIPLGVDTFGAFGPHGRALAKMFNRYANRLSSEGSERFPGLLQAECWQRVSVALHKDLGAQLSFALLGGPASPFKKPGSHQSTPPVSPQLY